MASTLKHPGVFQIDLRYQGFITLIQTDVTPTGLVRCRPILDSKIKKYKLTAQNMMVTKRNEKGTKLQESIVPMHSLSLQSTLNQYQKDSEQIRSVCRLETKWKNPTELQHCIGVLVEAFPKANDDLFLKTQNHLNKLSFFKNSVFSLHELLDQVASPHILEIHKEMPVQHYCPCSKNRVLESLTSLGIKELKSLIQKNSTVDTHCEFCRELYQIRPSELTILIKQQT